LGNHVNHNIMLREKGFIPDKTHYILCSLTIIALFGIYARVLDKSYSVYGIGLQELLLNLHDYNIRSSDILTSLNWTNLDTRRMHSTV
jgi:hypothetical protein